MVGGLKKLIAEQRKAKGEQVVDPLRLVNSPAPIDLDSHDPSVGVKESEPLVRKVLPPHTKHRGAISKSRNIDLGTPEVSVEEAGGSRDRKTRSESHGHKRHHDHKEKGGSKKKSRIFDPRAPGETNEMVIKIGEKDSWFHGSKPIQVFKGFHLLNDADEYVARSKEEAIDRAYRRLGQFNSDFVRLVSGFDVDERLRAAEAEGRLADVIALGEKRNVELAELKAAMERKGVEMLELANAKAAAEASLVEVRKEMELLKRNQDVAVRDYEGVKSENSRLTSALESVKVDLNAASSTLAATRGMLDSESAEKKVLLEELAELKRSTLLAGEEAYNDCWQRFVNSGADGSAHTWDKYCDELEEDEDEEQAEDGSGGEDDGSGGDNNDAA